MRLASTLLSASFPFYPLSPTHSSMQHDDFLHTCLHLYYTHVHIYIRYITKSINRKGSPLSCLSKLVTFILPHEEERTKPNESFLKSHKSSHESYTLACEQENVQLSSSLFLPLFTFPLLTRDWCSISAKQVVKIEKQDDIIYSPFSPFSTS